MTADVDLEISNLYPGINCLALCFVSCRFAWFKREANSTAHELAKFAAPLHAAFICNSVSLPPSVLEAWQRNMLAFS